MGNELLKSEISSKFKAMAHTWENEKHSYGYTFANYTIMEDKNMVNFVPEEVEKTWKERLFTLPWNPFKKTKTVMREIPREEIYIIDYNDTIVCHPIVARRLRKEIKKLNNGLA